jgi:hypothetical protein
MVAVLDPIVIFIIFDPGSSTSRAAYRILVNGCEPIDGLKTFSNAVEISDSVDYERKRKATNNNSLVCVGDEYWLVGPSAADEIAETNVRTPKRRELIPKVLAAIGQIAELHDIPLERVQIELGILMPFREVKECEELGLKISQALYEFGHNGKKMGCHSVKGVHICPEGYGYAQIADPSAFIYIGGHRDGACLRVEGGSISESGSSSLPGLGMVRMIRLIDHAFPDEILAAKAIFEIGNVFTRDKPLLDVIPRAKIPHVQAEIQRVRPLVWAKILENLDDHNVRSGKQILLAGGSGYYWKPEFQAMLKDMPGAKLSVGKALLENMQLRFPELQKPENGHLLFRCADAVAFWLALITPGFEPSRGPLLLEVANV